MEQQKNVWANRLGQERHLLIHQVVRERRARKWGAYSQICTRPMSRNKGYNP